MASAIKVLQVGISDLGVVPRDKSADYLAVVSQYDHYKKNNIALISLDENNEYNITESLLASIPYGELYDKDIKIFEWHSGVDGCLFVESYTDRQVNLFAELKIKKCLISAKGPLFIKGKLECESTIAIDAEALWLAESIKSSGDVFLAVRQGVGLLAPINAQHLIITASYVHQEAELQLSGQLDISTQCFKQDTLAKTTVNSLRLIASECQMRGDLTVSKACFLTAAALIWGHEEAESTFRLLGDNYIHARNLHIQGDTQARIGYLNNKKEGNFIVDQDLLIDEFAIVDIFNTELSVNEIDNQGELLLNQATTNAKTIQQQGVLNAEQSLVIASQDFIHGPQALTELKDTNISSPKMDICGEKFSLDNCNYKGQSFNVYAGYIELRNQSEIEIDQLWLLKAASLSIKTCKVIANQSFQASGEMLFENVDLETDHFKTIENKTIIKHSQIKARTQIKLKGSTELSDSCFSGKIMTLKGDLTVSAVRLNAKDLEITSEHATINSLSTRSEKLHLQGSKKSEQVILTKSVLTTERFSCLDHVTLEQSLFYGVSKEMVSHNLCAHFKIKNSKFITESQLSNYANGRIELEEHSTFRVGLLHSQGAMKAKDSNVTCEILWQENASLKLESSTVKINNILHTQASKITLKNNSIILAPIVQLKQDSTLKLQEGSTLAAISSVTTSTDSTINSNNSSVFTKKFIALGRTELCTSLLAAEELLIYDQFEANTMSKVTVEQRITVAKEARAKLSESTTVSNDIQIFGNMVASDSVVVAKNTLSVWSPATMTLEGNSLAVAEDMVVRGTLETQNKATVGGQDEKAENQEKQTAQLKVNGKLHIAKCATVKGTADLLIEADQYLHSGSMNLTADLKARGGLLSNFGSFNADSIYLGFDDKIANFGSFSTKDMTVHSNLLNLAGGIYVEKSLSVAGFYGANFGLIAANNYSNTTLLSVNGGLVLPNFSAEPGYIFSLSNFAAVGKIAAATFVPSYSNALNLAFMVPGLVNSAYSLYDTYENSSWEKYHNMRKHEWMAQICQFKGIASAAWGAFDAASAIPGEFSNLKTDLPTMADWMFDAKTYSLGNFKTAASKVDWQRFGTRTAGVFLGNYSDSSLIDINLGVSLTSSTVKKSLISINTGAEVSLLSHSMENNFFYNSGWSGGGEATFITDYTYNTGSLEGFNQFTFKAEGMINTGVLDGNNVNITINHLSQEGKLALHNGQAKIAEFTDTKDASSEFTDMLVTGTNFDLTSHLDAERTQFIYTDKFSTHKDSISNTKQVVIQAHEFFHGGQLDYEEGLCVEANKGTLEKGSIIDGKKTDEEELYVLKVKEENKTAAEQTSQTTGEQSPEPMTETVETEVEKEFKPQNIFQLHVGEKLVLNGKISGGDYTQIQGKAVESSESEKNQEKNTPKCESLIVGVDADIRLVNGSIDAQYIENSGHLELSKFSLHSNELTQKKEMKLDGCVGNIDTVRDIETASTEINGSSLEGTSFKTTGQLSAQNTRFTYHDEFLTEQSAKLATDNVEIITGVFEHSGELAYENTLVVTATTARLQENSVVNGKKTAEEDLFATKKKLSTPAEGTEQTEDTISQETSTTDAQVEEKEFKPQHMLIINAEEKVVLEGTLTGGDYTSIQGKKDDIAATSENIEDKKPNKVNELIIGDNANIKLTYGSIEAHNAVNYGQAELSKFSLDIDKLEQQNMMSLEDCVGQVTEFRDRETASTKIHNSSIKGDSFQLKGELDTKNTHYEYKEEFLTEESSRAKTDNVEIITAQFEHGGELAYENILSVKADRAHTKIGSVINGKKTAEEELFIPKTPSPEEQTTQTPEGQTSEGTTEVEKEFKPQSIFTLEVTNVVLDGALKGGDYTSINGKSVENADGSKSTVEKCESLVISDSAYVDLTYGSIVTDNADISAQVHLKGFNLDIGKTQIHQGGQLALEDSVYNGDILNSNGVFKLDHSSVTLNQMNLSNLSKETIKDSCITTTKFVDNSQLFYQGQAAIFTDHYEHCGRITKLAPPEGNADKNLFYVKAKTADLHGSSDIDNAIFAIDHFPDGTQFVSGIAQYNQYTVTSSLMLETQDYMNLNTPFYRDCDLTVKASGITMTADYNKARDLSLISTVDDVSLLSNITSNNLYVKSAGSIRTNHSIYSNEFANFEAAGGFYNLGGVVNANTVAIKASEIKNISAGSYAAGAGWGVPMGGAGIINGRTDAYLEATSGNIENYGGIIRSGNYTQLIAQGSVINACNIRTYRGAYDWITAYDGGLIAGGSGSSTEGVGLYIKAGGRVYSDASNFVSNGTNYIEGDQGIEFAARQETHISNIKKTKTWYGKSSKSVTTATTVTNSTVQSATGVNILVSEHGGVKSVATNFISPGGTQISARDNVELYNLKTQSQKYKSSSSLWGLSKDSIYEMHQEAVPTLFFDNGVTRIYSSEGSIDARGAYFAGAGDLDLKAHGRIKFGVDLLDHEVVEKTRSLGISVPGMAAWQAWKNSGSLIDSVTAEDATLAKLNSMLNSNNTIELLANSSNLGINLYNTTNSLMRGVSNDTLASEVLARYGLGGTDGKRFSPIINLSMTESTTRTKYQTQGVGGVNRGGNVSLEAGEGIDLENGVRVHAGGDMIVNAPEIIAKSAELHSSVDQTTKTQRVGISLTGQLQDASIGYSHTNTQSTQYVNAELSADGHMQLGYQDGAMRHVALDGAVIKAGSMDAKIEHLNIIDKQDTTITQTESFSASLSGQISAYVGKGDSAVVRDHSGIYVGDNTGHSVAIDEAYMKGGKILVNGGQVEIGKLVSEKMVDHESYTGIGISLNINDLERLAGKGASNQTAEQAIAVGELNFDRVNYKAEHTPVVYGDNGTHIEIKELVGEVHTESADGTKVIKNNELHLNLDVPITNASFIEKSRENIQAGTEKIALTLGLNGLEEIKLQIQEEPVLPSRRKEEEEEEEEEVDEKAVEETESDLDKKKEKQPTPEQEAALWQEILSKLPPDMKQELQDTLNEIQLEQKNGGVDSETKDKLKKQLLSAFNSVMKASSEEIWGKLAKEVGKDSADIILKRISSSDALSKLNVKTYLGTRGTIYISFIFNLFGASLDGKDDVWDDAIKSTVGDITLNFALKVTGSYAGPIGWAFVGIGVFDKLFYSKEQVKLHLESADRLADQANKALGRGEYFNSTYLMQAAVQNARMASNAEMIHGISERLSSIGGYVSDAVRDGWNKIRGNETTKPPSVVNRNSFFSPEKTGIKKNEMSMKLQNQQEESCSHII